MKTFMKEIYQYEDDVNGYVRVLLECGHVVRRRKSNIENQTRCKCEGCIEGREDDHKEFFRPKDDDHEVVQEREEAPEVFVPTIRIYDPENDQK